MAGATRGFRDADMIDDLGAPSDLPVIHACGGLIGTLGTGILVNPALGGMGIMDYTTGKIGRASCRERVFVGV